MIIIIRHGMNEEGKRKLVTYGIGRYYKINIFKIRSIHGIIQYNPNEI